MSYIPEQQAIFYSWQKNYLNGIVAESVGWGIPPAEITDLQGLQTIYEALYLTGSKEQKITRTIREAEEFRTAEKNYKAGIRKFNSKWISKNDSVTSAQKLELGVTVQDTVPTRIEAVNFAPQVVVDKISGGMHTLRFINPEDPDSKKMPYGQKIILRTVVSTANLPEDQIPWSGSETVKRFLHEVSFTIGDKGKTAYYIACYESNRGERGPWSDIIDAIVA